MVHVRIDRRVKERASKTMAAMGLSVPTQSASC